MPCYSLQSKSSLSYSWSTFGIDQNDNGKIYMKCTPVNENKNVYQNIFNYQQNDDNMIKIVEENSYFLKYYQYVPYQPTDNITLLKPKQIRVQACIEH